MLSLTMVSYFVNFKQSFMIPYLEESKKVKPNDLGKVLALSSLFQIISTTLIGFIINKAPKRIFIMLCFIMLTVSNILMGPSSTLKLDIYFMPLFFIGQSLNGFAQGFLFPPALPEVLDAIYAKQQLAEGENEAVDAILSDRASGQFGLFQCAGTISAPLVGSLVYQATKRAWPLTCEVFASVGAIYTLIFIVFNVIPDVHKEK